MTKKRRKQQNRKPKVCSQLKLLGKQNLAYGGELRKTRIGRQGPRPLSTKDTIHLVLRSSKAKGEWSFAKSGNRKKIDRLVKKFSERYYIKVISYANVGNHLHLQLKLFKRHLYKPFIRALTAAIMMAVTGVNRWSKAAIKDVQSADVEVTEYANRSLDLSGARTAKSLRALGTIVNNGLKRANTAKFWDYRPYTRIVQSYKAFLTLKDYIQINVWEGFGVKRFDAVELVRKGKWCHSTA